MITATGRLGADMQFQDETDAASVAFVASGSTRGCREAALPPRIVRN
jgi:hypothetical protein